MLREVSLIPPFPTKVIAIDTERDVPVRVRRWHPAYVQWAVRSSLAVASRTGSASTFFRVLWLTMRPRWGRK